MRRGVKTLALAVAAMGAAVAGAGAEEAASLPATRGTFVVPAGDRVHGHLRGGETHAIEVHLAQGDVYSFALKTGGHNSPLLVHMTMRDPRGVEINHDAKVLHRGGKKISVGPFRAAATGTYTMELIGEGWLEGDYTGVSKLKGAKRSKYLLPADGGTITVPVAAGSQIRFLTSSPDPTLSMTIPDGSGFAADSTLIASLRRTGLASSDTGRYLFASSGAGASIEISKPRWKKTTVEVAALPEDPARHALYDWELGWASRAPVPTPLPNAQPATAAQLDAIAALPPVPVFGTGSTPNTASIFMGGAMEVSVASYPNHLHDPEVFVPYVPPVTETPETPEPPPSGGPVPPFEEPPVEGVPPVFTDSKPYTPPAEIHPTVKLRVPTNMSGGINRTNWTYAAIPQSGCSAFVSKSHFANGSSLRSGPWTLTNVNTFPALKDKLVATNAVAKAVQIESHYFVDGHEVPSLLANTGDWKVTWTVDGVVPTNKSGSGEIHGSWALQMFGGTNRGASSCVMTGSETFTTEGLTETITVPHFAVQAYRSGIWLPQTEVIGRVENTLDARELGIQQKLERSLLPPKEWWNNYDRIKPVEIRTWTIDTLDSPTEWYDLDIYEAFLC